MKKLKFLEASKSNFFSGVFEFNSNSLMQDEFFRARLRTVSQSGSRSILMISPSCSEISTLAFEIWKHSKESTRTFISTSCSLIKDTKDLLSLFRRAEGGDLFLRDIHELSIDLCSYLQTLMKEKDKIRILASSHEECAHLSFESSLSLPPYKRRKEDIQKFVISFLTKRTRVSISNHAMDYILTYEWKGEYPELANCLLKSLWFALVGNRVCISKDDILKSLSFPHIDFLSFEVFLCPAIRENLGRKGIKIFLQEIEAFIIAMRLVEYEGNFSKVARSLQSPVTTLISRSKAFEEKIKEMSAFLNA